MRSSSYLEASDRRRGPALCRWALVVGVLLGSAGAVTRARGDSIELANGSRTENVQILTAKWDSVQYKLEKANATTIPGDKVLAIFRESPILQGARSALDGGDSTKALKDLTAIAASANAGAWEKAEASYLIGKAHIIAGDIKEAEKAFKAYMEKYKAEKDWYLPLATVALADSLLEAKQPGTAELQYKELAQYGGQWAAQAKLGEAKSILAQRGKAGATQARTLCDDVARSRDVPVSLRNQAVVIRAKAVLLQENPQQAVKELTDTFFGPAKQEVDFSAERAEATLLIGKSYAALGGKENLEQAEIWLLRVPALYKKQGAVYPEACVELANLYEKIGNAARAKEWRDRKPTGRAAPSAQPSAAPSAPTPAPAAPPAQPAKKASGGAGKGGAK
jgi:hypothetical protein